MLYQSVRPADFGQVVGNEDTKQALIKFLEKTPKKRPHAYIFHGMTGCGKTTLARIYAQRLGCNETDLIELNAATTRGIDTVRSLVERADLAPLTSEAKVIIFDESQQLTKDAKEALLKLLEDTPLHLYIIFCTTDLSAFPSTIKNRCTQFQIGRLHGTQIKELLTKVVAEEQLVIADGVVEEIVKAVDGIPREALVQLEKVCDLSYEEALSLIEKSSGGEKEIKDLCELLLKKFSSDIGVQEKKWGKAKAIFSRIDAEPESVRRAILGWTNNKLLAEKDILRCFSYVQIIEIFEYPVFNSGKAGILAQIFKACFVEE